MNEGQIVQLHRDGWSTHAIAKKFNTYPNKINRILKKRGERIRDKSEAQKLALETGRHEHPTEGKIRSHDVKLKIALSTHQAWEGISDDERARRAKQSKDRWAAMTEGQRKALQKAAGDAVRNAASEGSKVEKYILDKLRSKGYTVIFHSKNLLPNLKLEIDMFVPALKTVIEIDGPAHFLPIWGERNLQKHIKADAEKSGVILSYGWAIIRVKYLARSTTLLAQEETARIILDELEQIRTEFPSKGKRFIELEVE